jgi:rhamnosyltransferase subunit B
MHFLCCPFGSSGDVHPMLGLGLALKRRGHRVTMITNGYFRDLTEQVGLAYEELGTKEEFLELTNHPDIWAPMKAFQTIYREGVVPTMRQHYDLVAAHHRRASGGSDPDGALVTITNVFGFGALVAQEKLGIPAISLHLQPSVIWSDHAPPNFPGAMGPLWLKRAIYRFGERFVIDPCVRPSLNAWRAELGLKPMRNVTRWWHSPTGVACLFPAWFAPPQPDWPAPLMQTSFPLWDERLEQRLPEPVESFLDAGDPPLVFTPGSANVFGEKFFRVAVEASRQLGRRAILLTRFPEQIPASLPPGIAHFAYVPFSQLLPRAAALIHHGGIGSMSQAMAAGIPQVIVALAHDQFDNANRVAKLGIGDWFRHRQLSTSRLARTLHQLLNQPGLAHRCRDVADRLASDGDGLARMAEQLEERTSLSVEANSVK